MLWCCPCYLCPLEVDRLLKRDDEWFLKQCSTWKNSPWSRSRGNVVLGFESILSTGTSLVKIASTELDCEWRVLVRQQTWAWKRRLGHSRQADVDLPVRTAMAHTSRHFHEGEHCCRTKDTMKDRTSSVEQARDLWDALDVHGRWEACWPRALPTSCLRAWNAPTIWYVNWTTAEELDHVVNVFLLDLWKTRHRPIPRDIDVMPRRDRATVVFSDEVVDQHHGGWVLVRFRTDASLDQLQIERDQI